MARERDHMLEKSGVNMEGCKLGAFELTHLLSERRNWPSPRGTEHRARGEMAGKGGEALGYHVQAWDSLHFCLSSVPGAPFSLGGWAGWSKSCRVVTGSFAQWLWSKACRRNFVVTSGEMEKEFNRRGKGDWEGPLDMPHAFPFPILQGTDWLALRPGETLYLLSPRIPLCPLFKAETNLHPPESEMKLTNLCSRSVTSVLDDWDKLCDLSEKERGFTRTTTDIP